MTLARVAFLMSVLQCAAAQSVSCGNTYTFSIDRPGQRWRPRFCRWGRFTLYTCGAGKTSGQGGCRAPVGTLTDTVIHGSCRNDDSWGSSNSCCSQVGSGCSNLDIGAAKDSTGWAKLTVCCDGCPSCSSELKQLPAARWTEPIEEDVVPETVAPNVSAAYQSPDLQPDGVSGVGLPRDLEPAAQQKVAGTKFYLPLHKEVSLITCNNLEVLGRAIPSALQGDTEQWFDQVRVLHHRHALLKVQTVGEAKREELLKMETQQTEKVVHQPEKGSVGAVVSSGPQYPLGSLDIAVDGSTLRHTTTLSTGPAQLTVKREESRIGRGWVESLTFESPELSLELRSAVASKFVSERNRIDHLHVDMQVTNLDLDVGCTGVLPEMWGMAPMSVETAQLLRPPSVEGSDTANADAAPGTISEIQLPSQQGNLVGTSGAAGPSADIDMSVAVDMWG